MNTLVSIIFLVIMFVIVMGIIALLKKFVFPKIRINKYIPLVIAIVGLIVQWYGKFTNIYINVGIMILVVTFFSWYLDIQQTGGPKKSGKKVVIKPKAKPNRIKNIK
ncbi:hypothetical protein NNC19_03485 [Clostridium sp. SHJSY1]|uniref:hypothetical protein n=1 Tax=Clostridium sp. SHJSY1 TaxID=2942483 RepID=UPI0028761D7E|nr:hypothetical protein [Clostridium sp. SHJSY1]MDS0524728.1 hypothetical protein [Clostridium sp. SHJSY1]